MCGVPSPHYPFSPPPHPPHFPFFTYIKLGHCRLPTRPIRSSEALNLTGEVVVEFQCRHCALDTYIRPRCPNLHLDCADSWDVEEVED